MAKLTPDDMVSVKGFAPFEVADVFAEWDRRSRALTADQLLAGDCLAGLGPAWPMSGETPEAYGLRAATALWALIKEV